MKRLKEVAPDTLSSLRQRAIRDLAMGRIDQTDCDHVTARIDDLTGYILNMKEEEE